MNETLTFMPPQASTIASEVDALIGYIAGVSAFFVVLIAGLILFFSIKYRRQKEQRTPEKTKTHIGVEIVWTVIPLAIVMSFFFWGTSLFLRMLDDRPSDAYEVYVIGKQWMWKVQHPSGRKEINEVHLPMDVPVRFIMVSQDVIHSFFIPAFRLKHDVLPMRYTSFSIVPSKEGTYHLFCAEYCGTKHSAMAGRIYVMKPGRFQQWLEGADTQGSPVQSGEALLESLGCRTCHKANEPGLAPPLEDLYNGTVRLTTGATVKADENYLRESILNPREKVAAFYQPVMPSYAGRITEEELMQIIAYLKSVGKKP